MSKQLILLVLSATLIALPLAKVGAVVAMDQDCTEVIRTTVGCPTTGAEVTDGGVDVWAHQGTNGKGERGNGDSDEDQAPASGTPVTEPAPPQGPDPSMVDDPDCVQVNMQVCRDPVSVLGPESVDIEDLRRFLAGRPSSLTQPDGWALVGLDANLVADAPVQVASGEVLGLPASVRFTPVAFHWDYGDGGSATRFTPGGSWSLLGLPEFSATATSHRYATAGLYTLGLTVAYRAEYAFDAGQWADVPGTLAIPAAHRALRVGTATTVLVGADCNAEPTGPGCDTN